MKPYGNKYDKFKDCLRSTSKTAKLIAKNAERGRKKTIRQEVKKDINNLPEV